MHDNPARNHCGAAVQSREENLQLYFPQPYWKEIKQQIEKKMKVDSLTSFFIGWLAEVRCPSVCSGGQALGAVFNQLVRSRAQLLLLE